MNNSVAVWLLIFAVSAVVFLVIAVVVAFRGFFDLKSLLRQTGKRKEKETKEEISE